MTSEVRPLVEINRQAIRLLYRELGIADAVRFLRQFTAGFGDYTGERDMMFGQKTLDEIISEIEAKRQRDA